MIEVNDRLPEATLYCRGEQGLDGISIAELTKGRRIVIFAVPGCFTPTCSEAHLPGFLALSHKLREKGIDEIVGLAVNDPFVVRAWGESHNVGDEITLLSDGNGSFTRALGMERDMSQAAMGLRSKRYAMIVDDGLVMWLGVDESGLESSSAESVLAALDNLSN
ncbi:MAG TPA: peroxiredoxin [Halothiobacillus sp.]|nr:peroxiredoxin [Halothiobacillus sp.]